MLSGIPLSVVFCCSCVQGKKKTTINFTYVGKCTGRKGSGEEARIRGSDQKGLYHYLILDRWIDRYGWVTDDGWVHVDIHTDIYMDIDCIHIIHVTLKIKGPRWYKLLFPFYK